MIGATAVTPLTGPEIFAETTAEPPAYVAGEDIK